MAVLHGLAQNFQGGAFKLGQFVEKKHAQMREGNLARAGDGAATEQPDVGDGVMGSARWPL